MRSRDAGRLRLVGIPESRTRGRQQEKQWEGLAEQNHSHSMHCTHVRLLRQASSCGEQHQGRRQNDASRRRRRRHAAPRCQPTSRQHLSRCSSGLCSLAGDASRRTVVGKCECRPRFPVSSFSPSVVAGRHPFHRQPGVRVIASTAQGAAGQKPPSGATRDDATRENSNWHRRGAGWRGARFLSDTHDPGTSFPSSISGHHIRGHTISAARREPGGGEQITQDLPSRRRCIRRATSE